MSFEDYTSWQVAALLPRAATATKSRMELTLDALEEHVRLHENHPLDSLTGDGVIDFITSITAAHGAHHDRMLRRIVTSLRDALNWTRSPDALPVPNAPHTPPDADLISRTSAALQKERARTRSLRRLARLGRGLHGGLVNLVLEMLIVDSQNDARLLEYVLSRLGSRQRSGARSVAERDGKRSLAMA